MVKEFKINLDLLNTAVNNIFEVVNRDDNGNLVIATIRNKGVAVDLTGHTITIVYKNPLGQTPDPQTEFESMDLVNGKISFLLPSLILENEGKVSAEVILSKDGAIVTSQTFYFTVRQGIGESPETVPVTEIPNWQDAIAGIQEQIDNLDEAAQGADGTNAYIYIAYASDDSGTDFTTVFDLTLDYIAVKSTDTIIETPTASDFTGLWKNYKGEKGDTGATGQDGTDGASAFDIAVINGFVGTESEWLTSLIGEQGIQGEQGLPGVDGANGTDGLSAYQIWLNLGNEGTEQDYEDSLKANIDELSDITTVTAVDDVFTFDLQNKYITNFRIELSDTIAKTFELANVSTADNKLITVSIVVTCTSLAAITYWAGLSFIDTPVFVEGQTFWINADSYDGGTTWAGYSMRRD